MAAPVTVAHTHVHSIRLASGAEALVARVRIADGTTGFGFTLNQEAVVARDMAAWDALGRSKGVALHVLLGGTYRRTVKCMKDENPSIPPDWTALRKSILDGQYDLLRIDPFAWGSLEMVQTIAAVAASFEVGVALLAPNGHYWELQYCAALAATIKGEDTRIIIREGGASTIAISDVPGIGIAWPAEDAFKNITWQA